MMNNDNLKNEKYIDQVINKLHIQPAGTGYIDLICPKENIATFIDEMNTLGQRIYGFTWWCLVKDGHTACGAGGPKNKYGEGWYSETMTTENMLTFDSNESIRKFLVEEYSNSPDYKDCYCPGFWLEDL